MALPDRRAHTRARKHMQTRPHECDVQRHKCVLSVHACVALHACHVYPVTTAVGFFASASDLRLRARYHLPCATASSARVCVCVCPHLARTDIYGKCRVKTQTIAHTHTRTRSSAHLERSGREEEKGCVGGGRQNVSSALLAVLTSPPREFQDDSLALHGCEMREAMNGATASVNSFGFS